MATSKSQQTTEPKRLFRSKVDRIIAGVCGGFAEYFDIDPVIVRIIFLVLIFVNGWGFLLYLISLIVMRENPHQSIADRKQPENTSLYWGVGLIIIGFMLLAHQWDWRFFPFLPIHWNWFRFWFFDWDIIWPVIIILLGVLYLIHVLQQEKQEKTDKKDAGRLYRSRDEKIIGGVCGGLADQLSIDPVLVRIGWVVFALATSFFLGVIVYIIWMIAVPENPGTAQSKPPVSPPAKKPKTRAKRVKTMPKKKDTKKSTDADESAPEEK
ncbi:hypothetical protein B6D60_08035 [candidate division KSB1 bacterium 4484_87]|nr:MAG: hypothetical protein B6D60_08035 [candidate division KSB1 bacterium 4484_87]